MDNLLQKLKELKLKSLVKGEKSVIYGTIIGTIISSIPYLFYLYESVPDEKIWDTFLFTYESNSFEDANVAMWVLTGKTIPLLLLLIWFFTNKHWWYHAILVPIVMYIYQIIALFYDDLILDEFQLMYMLPVMAIIIPSIYLIRAQMFDKINNADKTMQELEDEFMIKPKGIWNKVKQYF